MFQSKQQRDKGKSDMEFGKVGSTYQDNLRNKIYKFWAAREFQLDRGRQEFKIVKRRFKVDN